MMNKEKPRKKNRSNKKSKMAILLYVLAILFFGYSMYSIYDTYNYVNQLISYGSVDMSTQLGEVISYYISTSVPFLFYAIVTWSMGYIISKINRISNHLIPVNTEIDTVEEINNVEEINESSVVEDNKE